MFTNKQTAEIVDKLTELTQHGQISWVRREPASFMIGPDSRVDVVYLTKYIGRNIRLYHQQYKYYLDDERYIWDDQVIVELIDDYEMLLARLPNTPNANELLRAIQFQNPQVSTFYRDLLG